MAGFKTHITVSSLIGVGYGGAAYFMYGVPWPTCTVAGVLCGMSGMMPDIDSDSSTPQRESMAFASAVVPMLLLPRFQQLELSHEMIVLAGAAVYFLIRFGGAALLQRFTVHRGMFHSLPAALLFGEAAFLLASGDDVRLRIYKGAAVSLGYLSHLLLDEIYSVDWSGGRLRLKQSFGTAMKFWGKGPWANLLVYAQAAVLAAVILFEPSMPSQPNVPTSVKQTATRLMDSLWQR